MYIIGYVRIDTYREMNEIKTTLSYYLIQDVSNVIINYLKPLPLLPFIDELKENTFYLYQDGEKYYNYDNYFIYKSDIKNKYPIKYKYANTYNSWYFKTRY